MRKQNCHFSRSDPFTDPFEVFRPLPELVAKTIGAATLVMAILFAGCSHKQAQTIDQSAATNPALHQELLRRVKEDQAIRDEWIKSGVEHPDQAVVARMNAIDSDNHARIKAIVKQYGWPGRELVGQDGADAAFLLVQHSELSFQKEMLPLVKKAFQSHQMSGQNYALLLDRVLVGEGKPQVYGTQAKLSGHEVVLDPIGDEANVDKRRAEVGLMPLSMYIKILKGMYFPDSQSSTNSLEDTIKQLPGGALTLEALDFLGNLKSQGKLPGVAKDEKGTYPASSWMKAQPEDYPVSRTFEFKKDGADPSNCHYTVVKASKDGGWRLQKAWRTDENARVVEEYSVR
jgi:hypothetical protein